jgi:hypothetical protein
LLDLKALGIDEITEEDYLCVASRGRCTLCTLCRLHTLHTLQLARSAHSAFCSLYSLTERSWSSCRVSALGQAAE